MGTLAQSIAEIEATLEACRETDKYLSLWKIRYDILDEAGKKKAVVELLEKAGYTEQEIEVITNSTNPQTTQTN